VIAKQILFTRPDGAVSICTPAPECMDWLACGGYWDGRGLDIDEQIERSVAAGHHEHAARRFVRAMDRGGCTTAEAYEIIRDRDCGHLGSAFELVAPEELPDRWFRNAWRRSHNGGPICVDMAAARRIQRARLADFAEHRRVDLSWPRWRERMRRAQTPEALKAIWPKLTRLSPCS